MTRQQRRWNDRKGYSGKMTRLESQIADIRRRGGDAGVRQALSNFSRTPDGRKRTANPRTSIWPEGKSAKPGRMG